VEESASANYDTGSVLSDLEPSGQSISRELEASQASGIRQIFKNEAFKFIKSFETFQDQTLGFLALALAVLEGAFGVVLLWGLGLEKPLQLRLWHLFRERTVLTSCFLVLSFAMGALAAYRGYELSPSSMNWILPTIVSCAIASVVPWILAFTLHYAIESAAELLGVALSMGLILIVSLGIVGVPLGWIVLSLCVLCSLGAAWLSFFLFCLTSWAFLLTTEVLSEAIRKFQREVWPRMRLPVPMHAVPASVGLLFVTLGTYLVFRGVVR
jgi:hypothetical protein